MNRRIATGLIATLVVTMLAPAAVAGAGTTKSCWRYRNKEQRFARKINMARTRRGSSRLRLDRHLSRVARRHTWEMKEAKRLYHTPSGKLSRRVTNWRILGENVGVGSTVRSLHRAFMKSPSHRANILHRGFRYVGVGTKRAHGRLWVTVIFESRSDPGTRLRMPSC